MLVGEGTGGPTGAVDVCATGRCFADARPPDAAPPRVPRGGHVTLFIGRAYPLHSLARDLGEKGGFNGLWWPKREWIWWPSRRFRFFLFSQRFVFFSPSSNYSQPPMNTPPSTHEGHTPLPRGDGIREMALTSGMGRNSVGGIKTGEIPPFSSIFIWLFKEFGRNFLPGILSERNLSVRTPPPGFPVVGPVSNCRGGGVRPATEVSSRGPFLRQPDRPPQAHTPAVRCSSPASLPPRNLSPPKGR